MTIVNFPKFRTSELCMKKKINKYESNLRVEKISILSALNAEVNIVRVVTKSFWISLTQFFLEWVNHCVQWNRNLKDAEFQIGRHLKIFTPLKSVRQACSGGCISWDAMTEAKYFVEKVLKKSDYSKNWVFRMSGTKKLPTVVSYL